MFLFIALLLTVLIEVPFMCCVQSAYRTRQFICANILVNIITNLTLNLSLLFLPAIRMGILFWEALIVLCEWGLLTPFADNKRRLLLWVLAANVLSYFCGQVLFHYFFVFFS